MNRLTNTLCLLVVVVTLAVPLSQAAVQFGNCGSSAGQLLQVAIPQCIDDNGRCFLRRGNEVTIYVRFRSFVNSRTAVTVVEGDLNGFVVPFPIGNLRDACTYSGVQCPVRAGQIYTFQLSMPLSTQYPPLDNVNVRVAVESDQGEPMFCAEVAARIQ